MKRLFFDIETSPNIGLFWEAGYKKRITYNNIVKERAIICISYKWQHEDDVHCLRWSKGCDKKMVADFVKVAAQADELVAHFGDAFDIKWVKARALIHGIDMSPFHRTFDTCKKARSQFKLNSYALNYLGDILGVGEKMETNYAMWYHITVCALLTRKFDDEYTKLLQQMCDYCDEDVRLLQRVYEKMFHVLPHNTNASVLNDGYKWQCPGCASKKVRNKKRLVTATGIIKREMVCNDCRKYFTISNKQYEEMVMYRIRNGEKAGMK